MPRAKLEVRQFIPEITPYALVALMELVAEYGVAPQRLLEGMPISVQELRDGTLVSNRQAWRMIRRALRLTGRADLGLELGRRQGLGDLGLVGVAMSVQNTFGDAAMLAMRDQSRNGSLVDQQLIFDAATDCAVLVARPRINDATVQPFFIEELFANAIVLARALLGAQVGARKVEFAYPAPPYVERYRAFFDCALIFDCAQNRLFTDRHWLEKPLPARSPVIAAELEAMFVLRENAADAPADIVSTVTSLLLREGKISYSITQVAQVLDVSVRTLRRRLDEAGTSFRQLSDRARAAVAEDLLRAEGMTVTAVGERLGFSDARAFRRAYKRWRGTLPRQVRDVDSANV